jgi:hypothetical protein
MERVPEAEIDNAAADVVAYSFAFDPRPRPLKASAMRS